MGTIETIGDNLQRREGTMTHRILVIGGYFDQIHSLVQGGYDIVVLLPKGRHKEMVPCMQVKTYFTNITDRKCCESIALYEHAASPFSATLSHYELSIPICARIAKKLSIPGPDIRTSELIRDKLKTRQIANNIGDVSTEFKQYTNERELEKFIEKHGKSVLKPAGGVGGRDVHVVSNKDDINHIIATVELEIEPYIIEKYVEGYEFSVEGFMDQNGHTIVALTGKHPPAPPNYVETVHVQSESLLKFIPNAIKDRLENLLNRFYSDIGYPLGPTHTEFILTDKSELYLLEGHLRTGGLSIWELTRATTLVDIFRHHTRRLLGEKVPLGIHQTQRAAAVAGISCQQGIVRGVRFHPPSNSAYQRTITPYPSFDIGDTVESVHPSRYCRFGGHIMTIFDDANKADIDDLINQARSISESFHYEF
ncbi:conserved hypothetical protein [Vibrio nigripulchritudo SOn1]|uniref:ATP-grasp domain-containing protein n=2 Tax=Vibrio nigripulchritudo TaxID=28173 RepID=A0AAV2VKH6_9VIBR|nr:conserved hypothetical protein [Vibrio nigripulchritudo SOn1]